MYFHVGSVLVLYIGFSKIAVSCQRLVKLIFARIWGLGLEVARDLPRK